MFAAGSSAPPADIGRAQCQQLSRSPTPHASGCRIPQTVLSQSVWKKKRRVTKTARSSRLAKGIKSFLLLFFKKEDLNSADDTNSIAGSVVQPVCIECR
jgi:hypothetical protein